MFPWDVDISPSKPYDANCIDSKMINLSFTIVMAECLPEQREKVSISFIYPTLKINEPEIRGFFYQRFNFSFILF